MVLGATLPHSHYFYGFDGLRVLRDGETEFKVRSDPRALLSALVRYHGVKHVLCTLGVLKDGEIEFKVRSDPRALLCALWRYYGVKHVLCTLGVLKDGEIEFKVRSDPRALLSALGRYHGVKHVLYTLKVLRGLRFLIIRVSTGAPGLKDRVATCFTGNNNCSWILSKKVQPHPQRLVTSGHGGRLVN
jgi:hypothetical protein